MIHEYARCITAALFMCLAKVPDAFNLPHRPRAEDAQRGNDGVVSERFSLAAAKAVADLVERFDIEPFSDFSAKLANFTGLVLFCIDAKFCKKIFVGKLLTRSTRFTCFCTAQTSIFQQIFVANFLDFS